ncbi:hypothetical protein OCL06_12075, partial [Alteromonas sp. ASW11-19]
MFGHIAHWITYRLLSMQSGQHNMNNLIEAVVLVQGKGHAKPGTQYRYSQSRWGKAPIRQAL